ncbi:MAG: hypothetical protein Unbinned2716contig1000_9 [Prokaryotic dsDNA virus sp.]|nr:MAG: hypothetical protein Unbinned2716contig1000_9 [Prokaryotic dsDNA virus sp.]|tara:strand:+ start:32547 stop:32867 length:321 start_codon:yes stop_codon:yes gene_type:complete
MGKKNHIKEIQRFVEVLSEELDAKYGSYPTIKDLLLHLSVKGLIQPIVIRNYLIIVDFYKQLKLNDGHMNHTFMDISIKYDLSERQIQTIIYEYQKKFQPSENFYR